MVYGLHFTLVLAMLGALRIFELSVGMCIRNVFQSVPAHTFFSLRMRLSVGFANIITPN